MPNYCNNKLILVASNELLNKFWIENRLMVDDKEENRFLSFTKSVPRPENESSFHWNINNWGTKWDTLDSDLLEIDQLNDSLEKKHTELTYNFDTAWSPPSKWLETIASIYKDITFELEYSEPGLNFYGKKKFVNGELIDDEECDLSEYNWSRVNMEILNKIVSNYHDVLTDDNIEEIAREIYLDYECEDDHLENINIYIEDLLRDQIKKNS
jgi:hypothetical protein